MHCGACDQLLNPRESTAKIVREDGSVEYPDLCIKCITESGLLQSVVFNFKANDHHDDEAYVPDRYDEVFGG